MILNKIKTVMLLATLSGLLLFLGNLFGGAHGLHFALILALAMNGIAYFFSDSIVLSLYGARPLDHERYGHIYGLVEELTAKMNLPKPKLYLIDSSMANAFATGRNPHHASIAVTSGIMQLLDEHELRGVLSHELAHIKNRDILVATIAATIATAIGYLASMLQHVAFWGSMGNNRRRGGNPLIMLVVAIVMPIAATLIQLAISRSREYLADETGARATLDPLALASALEKLHNHIPQAHLNPDDAQRASTAPLFIVHPFNGDSWLSIFSTHPPMRKRIERLHALTQKMF